MMGSPLGPTTEVVSMELYASAAQSVPFLLLGLFWQSDYLRRLKDGTLPRRGFWTLSRIRWWSIIVTVIAVLVELAALLTLANLFHDGPPLRAAIIVGIAAIVVTLAVRIGSAVVEHTS